jgi:GxxExxY protein
MMDNILTEQIIGCAIKIHKNLGPGLLESVYQNCLFYELNKIGLNVVKEREIPVIYDGIKFDCGFRADLIVNDSVLIETKCVEKLTDIHLSIILTYLKLSGIEIGLLMNFHSKTLIDGLKRVINTNKNNLNLRDSKEH